MTPSSEQPVAVGLVIAKREYRVGRNLVVAEVGTPRQAPWKRDWYCAVRIAFRGRTAVKLAYGIDALQVLILAIQLLRAELESLAPSIRWDGAERRGDFGVPKMIMSLGFDFTKRGKGMVDAAVLVTARRLERAHAATLSGRKGVVRRGGPTSKTVP